MARERTDDLLARLCETFLGPVPAPGAVPDAVRQSAAMRASQAVAFAKKLLAARLAPTIEEDVFQMSDALKRKGAWQSRVAWRQNAYVCEGLRALAHSHEDR